MVLALCFNLVELMYSGIEVGQSATKKKVGHVRFIPQGELPWSDVIVPQLLLPVINLNETDAVMPMCYSWIYI